MAKARGWSVGSRQRAFLMVGAEAQTADLVRWVALARPVVGKAVASGADQLRALPLIPL
jgi:hypothetical protein